MGERADNEMTTRSARPSYITPCPKVAKRRPRHEQSLLPYSYSHIVTHSGALIQQLPARDISWAHCLYLDKKARGGEKERMDNSFVGNLSLARSMLLSHAAAARCNMSQDYAHPNTSLRVHVPKSSEWRFPKRR